MGKSYAGGGNKAARMAQKEEAAAEKVRAQKKSDEDDMASQWDEGSKKGGKAANQAAKREEQAKQKALRKAMLEEETASIAAPAEVKKSNKAVKKTNKGPDLSQFDSDSDDGKKKLATINATGIDDALDALDIDNDGDAAASGSSKVDRHPERRFGPALARFEERRLQEMKNDGSADGLRLQQRKDQIRKEFERHSENPFNQVAGAYNSTKQDLRDIRATILAQNEDRLAEKEDD